MVLNLTLKCLVAKNYLRGWIVVQKRLDGTVVFHRNRSDYKNGFGNAKIPEQASGRFGFDRRKTLIATLLAPRTTCL